MTKRVTGFVGAVLLTIVGVAILLAYVNSAEERALEGEELTDVYVVAEPISRGTPAEAITDRVRVEQVPAKVRVEDAVVMLDEIEGLVAAIDLQPGEQITRSRFVLPQSLTGFEGPQLDIPDSFVQVAVAVEPQQAVGGTLSPGDQVSIFASFEPFQVAAPELPDGSTPVLEIDGTLVSSGDETPNSTHVVLSNVLVTNVQIEPDPSATNAVDNDEAVGLAPAPTRNLLVTVALAPTDAETLVFTAEHGSVWFASEGPSVTADGTFVKTRGNIHSDDPEIVRTLPADDGDDTVSEDG